MKQSTKLLSLVLALVMAFSCMSVIGNAALVKTEISWDNIDDADLTAEQVADLALDLVDNDLLAGMEAIDLSIVGELRLDSVDHILEDITDLTGGFVWGIGKGLLGDVGDLDFSALKNKQRSGGDLNVIYALLQFLGANANTLSKAAYGLDGGDGISLGLIGNFLSLGDVGDMLGNIPLMLTEMVYDMLVAGSDGYDMTVEEIKDGGSSLAATYPEMSTLDDMVNNALLNLLINRQSYEYEGEGDDAVKVWDDNSFISPSIRAEVEEYGRDAMIEKISPLSNTFFQILDNIAQYAIDDIGVPALNNNLKKALMEAVEADFNEIDAEVLPASVKAAFELDKAEEDRSYVTYVAYDCLAKANGVWYYTTRETEVVEDPTTGEPELDEDGNEVTERVRKFFRVNMAAANDFKNCINWDWKFVTSKETPGEGETVIDYQSFIDEHGSFFGSLNDIIGLVYDVALTDEVKASLEKETGKGWVKGSNEDRINDNVVRVVKYLLVNFGDKIFGTTSPYANLTWNDVNPLDVIDIVALIGPEFFEDAMPQIIIPKNADGTYAFHDGKQLLEFGALVIREFMTDIAPNINYDAYIFANGNVTSANDRLFNANNSITDWVNIILNMGLDIGATYLTQLTNFRDFCKELSGDSTFEVETWLTAGGGKDPAHWGAVLQYAIAWAVKYVSPEKSSGVLAGLDFNTVWGISGAADNGLDGYANLGNAEADKALKMLSYVLNTILPLGFVNGCTTNIYAVDARLVFDRLIDLFAEFDLNAIFGLFGRNSEASYNLLADVPLVQGVLDLVNGILRLVFRETILQETGSCSLDTVISKANLKTTVARLLTALSNNRTTIIPNALPTVGKLIKGWGTEQNFNTPSVSFGNSVDLTNGATSEEQIVKIKNRSDGVWRHYIDPTDNVAKTDNQYMIKMASNAVSVKVFNIEGTDISSTVSITAQPTTTAVDYGREAEFKFTASGVPAAGALALFTIKYQVIGEDGQPMSGGKYFEIQKYTWLNYNGTDAGENVWNDSQLLHTSIYTPQYVGLTTALETIPTLSTSYFGRDYKLFTSAQTGKITNNSGTVDGLTFASLEMKFSNSSGGRYFKDIRNFDSYTFQAVNEDGAEQTGSGNALTVNGSINATAWKNANKQPGSSTDFSITLTDKDDSENKTFSIIYIDDINTPKLASLAASEMEALRKEADYWQSGYAYTDEVLVNTDEGDAVWNNEDFVLRETNFGSTWVVEIDGEYSETDENGAKVTEATEGAKEVTKIDRRQAWQNYIDAFYVGIQSGMAAQHKDQKAVLANVFVRYNALRVAVNDLQYTKMTAAEKIENGGVAEDIGGTIDTLKTSLKTLQATTTDIYNYTDYKMYRLNRFNDARSDAEYYINLKNDASNATVAEIDESFPYTWINEDDLRALVKGDAYEANILALLEKMDEEEIESTAEWLEAKKIEYQTTTLLDVEMAASYLKLTSGRLLKRDHGLKINYLADEIKSAENMVKAESNYTAGSWANYHEALTEAKKYVNADGTATAAATQKLAFEAKYNLMVARNNLVLLADKADYEELDALIAQAEYALNNMGLYDNTAKEFGQVLAELGYKTLTNADGYDVQLFPGSALLVKDAAYGIDDQDKIDSAATALKEALARLKFVGTTVSGAPTATEVIVPADEDNDIEAITATVARIAPKQTAALVKTLFTVTADNAVVGIENITVSNDLYYTIDTDLEDYDYAGTNSTVTFYTLHGENKVKIPVKTIKIVVEGDVNGDGAVDVLDASYAATVASEMNTLEGCYLLAGDIDGTKDGKFLAADYSVLVNRVVGNADNAA